MSVAALIVAIIWVIGALVLAGIAVWFRVFRARQFRKVPQIRRAGFDLDVWEVEL